MVKRVAPFAVISNAIPQAECSPELSKMRRFEPLNTHYTELGVFVTLVHGSISSSIRVDISRWTLNVEHWPSSLFLQRVNDIRLPRAGDTCSCTVAIAVVRCQSSPIRYQVFVGRDNLVSN